MTSHSILKLESTGSSALDEILGGGIPAQSVTLIAGEPGSGKTILTLQMLFHAAKRGQKCLYFTTLSEPAMKVIRYMQSFEFFDVELFDQQIVFIDLGMTIRQGAEATLAAIIARVEEHKPDFIALDSFRSISELLSILGNARLFIYDLATQLAGWGVTTLLVGEYTRDEYSAFPEFAVADGIIRMSSQQQEFTSIREIEVVKMRGANYVSGRHFFDIKSSGLAVYPRVRAPESSEESLSIQERDSTGIAGLDELLDGGLPRGSATLIQGGTGTGKTIFGLNFLLEGARRKERGVLFTLEETPDQLRAIATQLGWNLAACEAEGLLVIRHTSPVELATDRFMNDARAEVRRLGAQRVVFDSLSTMALGVSSERRFKEMIYALAKHIRRMGSSLVMTMESEQLLGAANLSGLGVSFIADNLIQLRYVEMDGHMERAISVIKARGVKLNSELRSAVIEQGGLKVVADRFKELRGVLTGFPTTR